VVAEVSVDNLASKRLFMRANFVPTTARRPDSIAFEFGDGSRGTAEAKESDA
jgi:hypothetical protein